MLLGTVYPPPQKSSQGIFLWMGPPLTPHPGKDSLGIFFLVLKKKFKEFNLFFVDINLVSQQASHPASKPASQQASQQGGR